MVVHRRQTLYAANSAPIRVGYASAYPIAASLYPFFSLNAQRPSSQPVETIVSTRRDLRLNAQRRRLRYCKDKHKLAYLANALYLRAHSQALPPKNVSSDDIQSYKDAYIAAAAIISTYPQT
ncbi:hypothetical protein [Alloprevotella tannerae]|uniref:hypothetical protein n=1 Tax=Alloprevotella tannerae TaxID=76122 RepID=UPI0028EF484E|nr:hypothetical protein [Alloprevotella tannerae]